MGVEMQVVTKTSHFGIHYYILYFKLFIPYYRYYYHSEMKLTKQKQTLCVFFNTSYPKHNTPTIQN